MNPDRQAFLDAFGDYTERDDADARDDARADVARVIRLDGEPSEFA